MMLKSSEGAATLAKGACIAVAFSCAMIATAQPPVEDSVTHPDTSTPPSRVVVEPPRTSGNGDGGTLAGPAVLLWNNGEIGTGPNLASCPAAGQGNQSLLQNTSHCLNILGVGNGGTSGFRAADDFTLTSAAQITSIRLYSYNTGATTPTITGATAWLHSGRPYGFNSNVIGTTTTLIGAVTFTDIYRQTQTAGGCTRRIQQVELDTSSWPALPAGTYWVSWTFTSGVAAIFNPPVTILGEYKKPGSNAMQGFPTAEAATGTPPLAPAQTFDIYFDTGATPANCATYPTDNPYAPGAPSAAQDFKFELYGNTVSGCAEDITGDGNVGVADLLSVIGAWGTCTGCPQDINGDGNVGVADLLAVIAAWGPCSGGPPNPPAPATGACNTGGGCSVITYDACVAAVGIYAGDGTACP